MRTTVWMLGFALAAATCAAQFAVATPSNPVSKAQLERLLALTQDSDGQTAASTHAQLEAKRKTLPAWFPKAVWDDVERNVEAIHYADVVYPIYAKYLSSDDAEAEMLLFSGPTGKKIAAMLSGKGAALASTGLRGSAADTGVGRQLKGSEEFQSLLLQRLAELTPEEMAKVRRALPQLHATNLKIDDETHVAYRERTNAVVQQTMRAHRAEIVRAQQGGR